MSNLRKDIDDNPEIKRGDRVRIDESTVYVKGIGVARSIGKLDMDKLVSLLLKSKYITG